MVAAVVDTSLAPRRAPWHLILGIAALVLAAAYLASTPVLTHSLFWSVTLVAMTGWYIKCAWCVVRGGAAQQLLFMSAGMGIIHTIMAVGSPWFSAHHGHSLSGHPATHSSLMLLMAVAEFVLMYSAAAVCHIQRHQAQLRY